MTNLSKKIPQSKLPEVFKELDTNLPEVRCFKKIFEHYELHRIIYFLFNSIGNVSEIAKPEELQTLSVLGFEFSTMLEHIDNPENFSESLKSAYGNSDMNRIRTLSIVNEASLDDNWNDFTVFLNILQMSIFKSFLLKEGNDLLVQYLEESFTLESFEGKNIQ